MKAIWVVGTLLLTVSLLFAAEFKKATIVDVQDASSIGGGTLDEPAPNGVPTVATARIAATEAKFELTIELDGKSYTAIFPEDRHFQMTDLQRGQSIPARVEGKKLALERPFDGKQIKGKIIHQENLSDTPKK